ncbi:MAG: radical SAM protein [Elusimicrobia bacterium]|nr:radical SAM protein [Elusimicrobiota bacterium]
MYGLGFESWHLRSIPGIAELYAAERRDDPTRRLEFIDALDPGVPRGDKWVIMVSTQYGCCVGCAMCDAAERRFRGNVPAQDILAQIRTVLAAHPETDPRTVKKLKVHFARMGEPTFNQGVLEALEALAAEGLPGLLPSISTVAPDCPPSAAFLERLLEVKDRSFPGGMFQLQFSVHTTDAEVRRSLIPIRTWTLERMGEYARRWLRPGDRLVTLNVLSAPGLPFDPARLREVFDPAVCVVKLTPVHPTKRATRNGLLDDWRDPPERVKERASVLESLGFKVIINSPWPEETAGGVSCGQVASSVSDIRNFRKSGSGFELSNV